MYLLRLWCIGVIRKNKKTGVKIMLRPKIFSMIVNKNEDLNKKQIAQDFISGVIVAIIALPLSIALAIASGVSPEKGLITAVIAGFLISLLGGSRVQIGGPTGAFVIIVAGIVHKYGIQGLTIATILSGLILIIFGLLKFGSIIKFIPYPITTGFTSGIAIVLFSTQIKDFLGLDIKDVPSEFIAKWGTYFLNLSSLKIETLLIGLLSLAIIIFWPKINRKLPGSLVALIVATVVVRVFELPVETIGSRFGQISSTLPMPKFVPIDINTIKELIRPAATIAILAGIESLLSAVVADGMIGKKHSSNMELVAQGIANIGSAMFGGIPATGAIARTAANIKNGGKTPIAGMVHSVTLLLIMLIFMPLAKLIPMTTLAAILIVVSYNMSEWRAFKSLLKSTNSDIAILFVTFLLTVVFDLVIAIEIGMILAMFLFMKRMSESISTNCVEPFFDDASEGNSEVDEPKPDVEYAKERIMIYEINGPLFFGAAGTFLDILNQINSSLDILIIRMRNVPFLDATAYNVLQRIDDHCRRYHIMIIFSEVNERTMQLMARNGYIDKMGADRFFGDINSALQVSRDLLGLKQNIDKKRNFKRIKL